MSARVTVGRGAEPRGGSREASRYAFAVTSDRTAMWIAVLAPMLATLVVLIAR